MCLFFIFFTCMSYLYPGSIVASTTVFNSRLGFESLPGFLRETFTIYWWREMVKSMNYVTKWFIFVWIWFYATIGNTPWNNFTPHFVLFFVDLDWWKFSCSVCSSVSSRDLNLFSGGWATSASSCGTVLIFYFIYRILIT